MRRILLSLAFGILGCAINPRISRMEHYSKESKKPIIYGGISGIPEGYSFLLHFEHQDPKGQVRRVSRDFEKEDAGAKDGVFKYAFFLPPGRWTLRQIELMGLKESGESTLVTRSPKKVMVVFKMQDSLGGGFAFDAVKDSLHYLGRWTFGGFESLDAMLPEAIARFNASKKKAADSSRHSVPISLAVEDSTESDLAYFIKHNSTLRSKKSRSAIPADPIRQEAFAFDLLVANPESPPNFMMNDWHMRQMMAPRIPKF